MKDRFSYLLQDLQFLILNILAQTLIKYKISVEIQIFIIVIHKNYKKILKYSKM